MCERDKKSKQGREQRNSLKSRHVVSLLGLDVQRLTKVRIDAQQCEKANTILVFSTKISLSEGRDRRERRWDGKRTSPIVTEVFAYRCGECSRGRRLDVEAK